MIKSCSMSILLCSAVLILASCDRSPHSAGKDELKKIVDRQNELLGANFIEGNADRVAALYTDSAKLSPNGGHFVYGRDSIKAFWAESFKTSKTLSMRTEVLTVDGTIDVIYETGRATSDIVYQDSTYHVTVKYINVWQKQPDGSYRLDVDFWNKDGK